MRKSRVGQGKGIREEFSGEREHCMQSLGTHYRATHSGSDSPYHFNPLTLHLNPVR